MKKIFYCPCRIDILLFSMISLSACGQKHAQALQVQIEGEDATPSRQPTKKNLLEITAPNYKSPAEAKHDCLGRLIFDIPQKIEWPVFFNANASTPFNRSFGLRISSPGDEMRFGHTLIAVIGTMGSVKKEKIFEITPLALERRLEKRIKETRAYIVRLKQEGGNPEKVAKDISEAEEWILGWEKTISEDRIEFEAFDPGLPNSEGYWTTRIEANDASEPYSVFRAYLTRGEYIYVFESSFQMKKPSDKDIHKKEFTTLLAKFRTREANEIPTEMGVCVPFGFLPDDGSTVVEFKQSLRFPDAPGVLYTIETGNVHPRRLKFPPLSAAAHATINPLPTITGDEVRAVVTQRIGPRIAKIGGLSAEQGGTVLKVDQPGHENYEVYSVFTGYSGWLGTAVLPYILVEMHTKTKMQAPALTQNPPPFKQSMDRLEFLLNSIRWRPTIPSAPELKSN